MTHTSTINTECLVRFETLNAMLGKDGPVEGPGGMSIREMKLRGDTALVYADADVKGPYTGKATLQFKPGYDRSEKQFTVSEVEIRLEEESIFGKFAGKMINNLLGNKLDAKLEELINAKFQAMLTGVLDELKNLRLEKGGHLHFDTKSWQISDLRTDEKGLSFTAELIGGARLEV